MNLGQEFPDQIEILKKAATETASDSTSIRHVQFSDTSGICNPGATVKSLRRQD
jgi:hypothetical protein